MALITHLPLALVICGYFAVVSGFILEGKCPLGPPCECVYNTITCSRRNLTSIPAFTAAKEHYNSIALTFNFNRLTKIPARVFSDLGSAGARTIEVKLAWNQIFSVDPDAFEGIENAVTLLDLSDNRLVSLPAAINKLPALRTLNIDANPLSTLSDATMTAIGDTVSTFTISLDLFQTWPAPMHRLSILRELTVSGFGGTDLPNDAFSGFNSTLHSLTLDKTMLANVPSAICDLQNTKTFTFASNHFINKSAATPCDTNGPLPRAITTLTMSDNDFVDLPDDFKVFPGVTRLSLANNQILSITDSNSYDGNHVVELDLTNNSLATAPRALTRFQTVTVLRLDFNSIKAIGADDFSSMINLRLLYLTNNPIQSIDPTAFRNNGQITILDLSNTQLTSIPVAIASLPHLSIFHLTGGSVECSCTGLTPLKTWNASIHSSIGPCAKSPDTIKDFLVKDLPSC